MERVAQLWGSIVAQFDGTGKAVKRRTMGVTEVTEKISLDIIKKERNIIMIWPRSL